MIEIFLFVLVFLAAFSAGSRIMQKLRINMNFYEILIFSSAIGLGLFSYLTFLFGMLGLLYKAIFWVLIIAALFLSRKETAILFGELAELFSKAKKIKGLNLFLILVLALFALINFIASMSPPYLWDEMMYNIAVPKLYALHHGIYPIYDEFRADWPSSINMLFTMSMVIGNAQLAKLFMLAYGTLLAAAIFSFSMRYFSLRASLFAAAIFYTMPMISNHISSTYTDIGVAFYIFMAFYSFYLWRDSNNDKWLFLSAVMSGLAIASKLSGLYYLIPIFFCILYKLVKDKNPMQKIIYRLFIYFAIAFLIFSPWLVKNYLFRENPVFPFVYSTFGGKYWSAELNENFAANNFIGAVGQRTPLNFLTKFWDLTMHSSKYGMLLGFGPIFLAFVPIIIFLGKKSKAEKFLLAYSGIAFTVWFFGPQVLRYLMIYPMLSIVSGNAINKMLDIKKIRPIIAAVLLSTMVFNAALWYGANRAKLPYVFGFEDEQAFYSKLKDNNGYSVFKYANENLPKDSRLLLFREFRGYLSDLDYVKGDPSAQNYLDYSKISDSGQMYNELKKLGITHVFVNTKLGEIGVHGLGQPPHYTKEIIELMDKTLKQYGNLLYEDKGVYLYEIAK